MVAYSAVSGPATPVGRSSATDSPPSDSQCWKPLGARTMSLFVPALTTSITRHCPRSFATFPTFATQAGFTGFGVRTSGMRWYLRFSVAIVLQVDEETLAAARRLDEARRELDLDELARRQVKARLEFLKTECLADPGTAKIFALIGSSPRVGGPPDDATLDEIVRAVHTWRPESRWIELAQLLHQFLRDLNHSEQAELLHIMQSAVRTLGRDELADRIASLTPPAKFTSQSADGLNEVVGHDGGAHRRTSGSV
jgi:hypothetical protein